MIKNYTTQISFEKTVGEIQALLARAGACQVLTEYSNRIPSAICFRMKTSGGDTPFRLPANIDKVHAVLIRDRGVPKKFKTEEQAARVGWRIVKDWIAAQLAFIESEMVELVEVFLPYAQGQDGSTIYERFTSNPQLLLGCA